MHGPTTPGGALLAALATGTLIFSACGGSDDADPGDTTTSTTTTITDIEPPEADDSDPADTAPDTEPPATAPATTDAATTVPPTTATGLTADCLEGDWVLDAEKTNELFTSLLPGVPLSTDGSVSMSFDGDAAETYINIVATFTVPDGSVSGPLDQHFAGTYEITDGAVLITNDVIEGGWGNLTGTIKGVSFEVPAPPAELPPFTGGPATCDGPHFSLQYTSGLADAIAVFDRA